MFANIDFQGIGTPKWAAREVAQLEKAKALGARGVKIAKNLGLGVKFPDGRRVPVDDPVLDPVFDAMGQVAPAARHPHRRPQGFFRSHGTGQRAHGRAGVASDVELRRSHASFPAWDELYGEFERRVKRSKNTTIIGVHFGNAPEEPDRVERMIERRIRTSTSTPPRAFPRSAANPPK